ncbi:hypothetical protein N8D56_27255 (plasmid) [Devosia sp. A8/3-2]|nr:hypothetical protein N8D56_27255 [Devosia sp. A8/3-2]
MGHDIATDPSKVILVAQGAPEVDLLIDARSSGRGDDFWDQGSVLDVEMDEDAIAG